MKWILVVIAIVVVIGSVGMYMFLTPEVTTPQLVTDDQLVIGLSMGTLSQERWLQDRSIFVEKAEELGARVIILESAEDPDVQVRQSESLILQGVDVLVVVAADAQKTASIVDTAHNAGIKVVAYDRLIRNPALDYYISFDNLKVGESQAQAIVDAVPKGNYAYVGGSPTDNNAFLVKEGSMRVLQPLIDSGDIKLVYEEFHDGWKQEAAYRGMKEFLDNGGSVDAVVAANDSTALGVILALEEHGLAGKVPVSGQDASLAAVQNLLSGKQTVTIYKPIRNLATAAAEMAVAVAKGERFQTNSTVENGEASTPAYLLDVVSVTKENIEETVIEDGFHERSEVYGL